MAYIRNLKKSFKYLVKDLSEEYIPNTTEAVSNITGSIKTIRQSYNKSGSMKTAKNTILRSNIFRDLKKTSKKYFDDVRQGKVYTGKDAGMDDMFGDDDGLTNYNDMYYDDTEESKEQPTTDKPEVEDVTEGSQEAKKDREKSVGVLGKIQKLNSAKDNSEDANYIIDSTEALAMSNAEILKTLHIDNKITNTMHFKKITDHLSNMDEGLQTLVKFNNEVQKKFIEETTKYYEDQMNQLTEMKSILRDGLSVKEEQEQSTFQKGKGIFDYLREGQYGAAAKEGLMKLLNSMDPSGSFSAGFSVLPMKMQEYKANPSLIFKNLTKFGLNRFAGFDVFEKIDSMFNETKSLKNSLFNKMSLSDNKFAKMIGNALRDKGRVDDMLTTGNYNKGRTFFDGITKRAITEVIPTYLRKIHSALTGNEELVYNYDEGKFKQVSELADEFYRGRPDFEAEYGRISNLISKNIDKSVAGEIDKTALESVVTKMTDGLLNSGYTLSDVGMMNYSKFLNLTGMTEKDIDETEFNIIKNSIMKAKTSEDQLSGSEFRDIVKEMRSYTSRMSSYYADKNKSSHMTGLNALLDDSLKSQGYGIKLQGGQPVTSNRTDQSLQSNQTQSNQNITDSVTDENAKDKYKRLKEYDPMLERKTVIDENRRMFDVDLTEEEKEILNKAYGKLNLLDYLNTSGLSITNLKFLKDAGIDDIKEIKEWREKDPYNLENILKTEGKNVDETHEWYFDNKVGEFVKSVEDKTKPIKEAAEKEINRIKKKTSDEEDLDEETKKLNEQTRKLFQHFERLEEEQGKEITLKDRTKEVKDKGYDLFKDYKPDMEGGIDLLGSSFMGLGGASIASLLLTGNPFLGPLMSGAVAIGSGLLSKNTKLKSMLFGEENKDKGLMRNISERFLGEERTDEMFKSVIDIYSSFKENFISPIANWTKKLFQKPVDTVKQSLGMSDKEDDENNKNPLLRALGAGGTTLALTGNPILSLMAGAGGLSGLFDKPIDWAKEKFTGAKDKISNKLEKTTDQTEQDVSENKEEYGSGINKLKKEFYNSNKSIFGKGVTYFSQNDPDLSSLEFSSGGSYKSSGCGLACAAMAISNILDVEISPSEIADIADNYKISNDGIGFGFFKDISNRFDIPINIFSRNDVSLTALDDVVSDGAMIISLYEDKTGSLHYVLVRNGDNKYFRVDDPARESNMKIPKELIYAKSRNFIVYYPKPKEKSKPSDGKLKSTQTESGVFGKFVGNLLKDSDNGVANFVKNSSLIKGVDNLSQKVSDALMESIETDIDFSVPKLKDKIKLSDVSGAFSTMIKDIVKSGKIDTKKIDETINDVFMDKDTKDVKNIKSQLVDKIEDEMKTKTKQIKDIDYSNIEDKDTKSIKKQIKNSTKKIIRKQEELLNGAAWNLDYIRRILEKEFGELPDDLKPDVEGGKFGKKLKRRKNALIMKVKNIFGGVKDKVTDTIESFKENVTKPFKFVKDKIVSVSKIPGKAIKFIKDRLPSKDGFKKQWDKITNRVKDMSENIYFYGLEFKDKIKSAATKIKDTSISFMKDMKKRSIMHFKHFKEKIIPKMKESLDNWKEKGKDFFDSAKQKLIDFGKGAWRKTVAAKDWTLEKIRGWDIGGKIGSLKDKVFGKAGEILKKKKQKVYVEGGFLDAVGVVGAIDMDHFNQIQEKIDKISKDDNDTDIDHENASLSNVSDDQQEKEIERDVEQTSLLSKIKDKLSFGTKDNKSKEGGFFSDTIGKVVSNILPSAVGGGAGVLAAKGGLFAAGKSALAGAAKFAGPAAGGIWSLIDSIRGVFKSEEWLGEDSGTAGKVQAGIGGALGGHDSGVSGLLKGAIKGALIGIPFGGPIGTAIGAIIGGGLGLVGGENISKALRGLTNGIVSATTWVKDKFTFLKEKTIGTTKELSETSYKDLFSKTNGIQGFLKGAVVGAKHGPLGMLFGAGLGALANPLKILDNIKKPIQAITNIGGLIKDKIIGIKDVIWNSKFGSFIEASFKTAGDVLDQFIDVDEVVKGVKENINNAKKKISETASNIKKGFSENLDKHLIRPLKENVINPVSEKINEFKEKVLGIGDNIKDKVNSAFYAFKNKLSELGENLYDNTIGKIKTSFDNFSNKVSELGENLYDNTIGRVKDKFDDIAGELKGFKDFIVNIVTDPLGFIKKMAGSTIDKYAPDWVKSGVEKATGLFGKIGNTISNTWNSFGNFGKHYKEAERRRGRGSSIRSGKGNKLINQKSNKFNDIIIGNNKFSDIGCAPSVVSMVLQNENKETSMETLAKEANLYSSGTGVDFNFIKNSLANRGIHGIELGTNISDKINMMNENDQIILLNDVNKNDPYDNHYVLLKKENGKLVLYDPLKNSPQIVSKNSSTIKNSTAGYLIRDNNLFGGSKLKKVNKDILFGSGKSELKNKVDKARLNQLNKIKTLKNKVQTIKELRKEIINNSQSSEKIIPINNQDNTNLENKLDTLIDEVKNLAKVFTTMGQEIVSSNNNTNVNIEENNNEVNNNPQDQVNDIRDTFLEKINQISAGIN